MKRIALVVVATTLAASSCKKQEEFPSHGMVSVKINGTRWVGSVGFIQGTERLSLGTYRNKKISGVEVPWELLGLALFNKKEGKQTLYKRDSLVNFFPEKAKTYAVFSTMQDDGDVGCDLYAVDEADSANNWLEITEQEGNYTEIQGVFSVTFYRTDGCASSPYPDTLRFREGRFHAFVQ